MRISVLKSKTEDYRLRGALSGLWDCFYGIICPLPEETTIEEVYYAVCKQFAETIDIADKNEKESKLRAIKDISKVLYRNRSYWRVVTGKTVPDYRLMHSQRLETLTPLFEKLENNPDKQEIVKFLAKDEEITNACMFLSTWQEVYEACERIIVSRVQAGNCNWVSARLMYMLSKRAYDSHSYWLQNNNLTSEQIRNLYVTSKKKYLEEIQQNTKGKKGRSSYGTG